MSVFVLKPIYRQVPDRCSICTNRVYDGIYLSSKVVKSLHLSAYSGAVMPKIQTDTLYLTFSQEEMETLQHQVYGSGEGSNIPTNQSIRCSDSTTIRSSLSNMLARGYNSTTVSLTQKLQYRVTKSFSPTTKTIAMTLYRILIKKDLKAKNRPRIF